MFSFALSQFAPTHLAGLWLTDLRRILGVVFDTSPLPRPTKLRYMRTAAGFVVLYPRVLQPPAWLPYIKDSKLGNNPATGEPQMRLPSDSRGMGALLVEAGSDGLDRAFLNEIALVPLVDVTGLLADEEDGSARSAISAITPTVVLGGSSKSLREPAAFIPA